MTTREAKLLLVGTIVMWDDNPSDLGTVRKLCPTGVYIDWENGQRGWIDYRDAKKISIL